MNIARLAALWLAGCSVALLLACSRRPPARPPVPVAESTSAAEAMSEMRRRYERASSYEDTGELSMTITREGDSDPSEARVTFSTAFQRSTGSFRFEYTKTYPRFFEPEHAVIWRRGSGTAHVWWTAEPRVVDEPLDQALAAQAGVSNRTSAVVTYMLLGIDTCAKTCVYSAAGGETVRGVPCLKIAASSANRQTTMWIGREDHALYRFAQRTHTNARLTDAEIARVVEGLPEAQRAHVAEVMRSTTGDLTGDETIELSPRFDQPIAEDRFDFTPPP